MICHDNYDKHFTSSSARLFIQLSYLLDAFGFFSGDFFFCFQRSRDRANAFIIISNGFVFFILLFSVVLFSFSMVVVLFEVVVVMLHNQNRVA